MATILDNARAQKMEIKEVVGGGGQGLGCEPVRQLLGLLGSMVVADGSTLFSYHWYSNLLCLSNCARHRNRRKPSSACKPSGEDRVKV